MRGDLWKAVSNLVQSRVNSNEVIQDGENAYALGRLTNMERKVVIEHFVDKRTDNKIIGTSSKWV
ncbi:hypothetical protein [Effusibacillus lacus]|uniref:hypothetical protein n=1 Tax=Effusibacillus lacus TaxID=1348429 RepID=UPI000BB6A98F|nr:hypothetical protein [Effusibacillus lacus]TCS70515.1 hypothetical protein EDD64_13246 [Effusibacillus lacus]